MRNMTGQVRASRTELTSDPCEFEWDSVGGCIVTLYSSKASDLPVLLAKVLKLCLLQMDNHT